LVVPLAHRRPVDRFRTYYSLTARLEVAHSVVPLSPGSAFSARRRQAFARRCGACRAPVSPRRFRRCVPRRDASTSSAASRIPSARMRRFGNLADHASHRNVEHAAGVTVFPADPSAGTQPLCCVLGQHPLFG
jgi:hypothetical protein